MRFVKNNENNEEYYSVEYDKEKLKEILERLKEYSYVTIDHCHRAGDITRWPASERIIKKRVISLFRSSKRKNDKTLRPETIVHHTEDGNDYVTYDYSYTKLPDLYDCIDIILNNKNIMRYTRLFKKDSESVNMFYALFHWDQLVLEALLNYSNSPELTKHDSINSDDDYDYEGLNELYKETLNCFKFNLIAIKEYLSEPQEVDVIKLQLKK